MRRNAEIQDLVTRHSMEKRMMQESIDRLRGKLNLAREKSRRSNERIASINKKLVASHDQHERLQADLEKQRFKRGKAN
eukprot:7637935-Pyramimonas_sp.AAC.1